MGGSTAATRAVDAARAIIPTSRAASFVRSEVAYEQLVWNWVGMRGEGRKGDPEELEAATTSCDSDCVNPAQRVKVRCGRVAGTSRDATENPMISWTSPSVFTLFAAIQTLTRARRPSARTPASNRCALHRLEGHIAFRPQQKLVSAIRSLCCRARRSSPAARGASEVSRCANSGASGPDAARSTCFRLEAAPSVAASPAAWTAASLDGWRSLAHLAAQRACRIVAARVVSGPGVRRARADRSRSTRRPARRSPDLAVAQAISGFARLDHADAAPNEGGGHRSQTRHAHLPDRPGCLGVADRRGDPLPGPGHRVILRHTGEPRRHPGRRADRRDRAGAGCRGCSTSTTNRRSLLRALASAPAT